MREYICIFIFMLSIKIANGKKNEKRRQIILTRYSSHLCTMCIFHIKKKKQTADLAQYLYSSKSAFRINHACRSEYDDTLGGKIHDNTIHKRRKFFYLKLKIREKNEESKPKQIKLYRIHWNTNGQTINYTGHNL